MADTYLFKIQGKAESPKPTEIGHNYRVSSEGSIVSVAKSDNEDGTFTYTALFKPIRIEVLNDLGETLKLNDTRSMSQQFRALMWRIWKDRGDAENFEEVVYPTIMRNLLRASADVYAMFYK